MTSRHRVRASAIVIRSSLLLAFVALTVALIVGALLGHAGTTTAAAAKYDYDHAAAFAQGAYTSPVRLASSPETLSFRHQGDFASFRFASRAGVAAEEGGAAFRYVTEGEVKVAERTGRVPNIDRLGNPKSVFYSTDRYGSAAEAEKALQLGRHNPTGATASPTHVIMASSRGANWSYGGNVEGGTGVELITENPLDVLGIWRLGP